MTPFFKQLPLWLSLGFSLLGVIVSIRLAILAYRGVLFVFVLLLTGGILVFGFHHLIELADPSRQALGQNLDALSSAVFLAAAIYMGYRLRKILSDR